jgi:hypothetical protein
MTIVLNGQSSRLITNGDGNWWAEDDSAGWRVQRLTIEQTEVDNGARGGETFKITTRDGTEFFFGSRPASAGGGVLNVEVYNHESHEPCYVAGGFHYSHCPMPYRWNLDRVVDVKGNVIDYQWGRHRGSYGGNGGTDVFPYDISANLQSIEYGKNLNAGTAGSRHLAKVVFKTDHRCFNPADPSLCEYAADNKHLWRDSPWDQHCAPAASSCGNYAPTFWGIWRLTDVSSYLWDPTLNAGTGGWPTAFVDWACKYFCG